MKVNLVFGAIALVGAAAISLPASAHGHRHHHHYHHHGAYGLDVAPGGGFYTARDVLNESPRRMSHPYVGEPAAPSIVARGPHRHINRVEMRMTARLNLHQLHRHGW